MLKWGSVDPSKACQVGEGKWPRVDKDRVTRILASFRTFFFLFTSAAVQSVISLKCQHLFCYCFLSWRSLSPHLIFQLHKSLTQSFFSIFTKQMYTYVDPNYVSYFILQKEKKDSTYETHIYSP